MKGFAKVTMAWNVLVLISLFAYYWNVFLNVTMTNEQLTPGLVSFYKESLPWGLAHPFFTDQFGWNWIWLFTDILRMVYPMMFSFLLAYSVIAAGTEFVLATGVCYAAVFIIEVFKTLMYIWEFWFCPNFQLCRNWNPNDCHQKFDCPPNYLFEWVTWYSLAFIVVQIIYLLMLVFISSEAEAWHKDLVEERMNLESERGGKTKRKIRMRMAGL